MKTKEVMTAPELEKAISKMENSQGKFGNDTDRAIKIKQFKQELAKRK